jgi:type IV secretion system protein VirB2
MNNLTRGVNDMIISNKLVKKLKKKMGVLKTPISHIKKYGALSLLMVPGVGHATASVESVLNKGVGLLQGPLAKGVGVMAIVGSGYLCLARNKLPKEQFVMILVGLGIIFGGSSLFTTLTG